MTPTTGLTTPTWRSRETLPAAKATEFKRAADTKYDYGINLGGPIRVPHLYNGRDKSFFFFNWEQWR